MAAMFQSLRSSSMPKRLLRYALGRLELLDAEALDMDNLDLAIGRNTVLEFRDVGIKLKKLERILKLPPSFKLRKAKVLLLRVTIPVDFYTSPITIEVDGVDIRLSVGDNDGRASWQGGTPVGAEVVPNTVDLAESFLEQQPDAEKKQLEEALAAETQDLGASVAMSDDGSEDEASFGTGQPLSLPAFLGDFLQGIVDRTQIKIRTVTFQLDVDVPLEAAQTTADTVTFQIALEGINVEGVTVQEFDDDGAPTIVPREGKRHISLANIRAYLVSEANVFSAFARSPSMPSPAVPRSPADSDRSPLSREGSALPQSYDDYLMVSGQFGPQEYPMRDSEAALEIPYEPYDLPDEREEGDGDGDGDGEDGPATPRASIYQDFGAPPSLPPFRSEHVEDEDEDEVSPWLGTEREASSAPTPQEAGGSSRTVPERPKTPERGYSDAMSDGSSQDSDEDLAQSHIYTHEEAASMYASAVSELPSQSSNSMPGSWDYSPETSPQQAKWSESPPLPPTTDLVEEPETFEDAPPPEAPQKEEEPRPEVEDVIEQPTGGDEETQEQPASPPQDETPRGPTRLVKEILSLKNISVYVPLKHKHIQVHPGPSAMEAPTAESTYGLGKSVSPRVPGAFSVYSGHESIASSASPRAPPATPGEQKADHSLEVILSPLEIRFDASLGFLLATVVSKLLEALKDGAPKPSSTPAPSQEREETRKPMPEIKMVAERISLCFLHHLMGVADTPERILNPMAFEFDYEVLLRADISDLTVTSKDLGSSVTTLINLGKFRFGYANGDILSFDRTDKMGASIRDVFPPEGADVSVKLTSTKNFVKAEVTTLALMVQVDLQRLDETFGWFGGLSSFLNMGASMSSSAAPSKVTLPPPPKPRGVRFDTPINPDDRSAAFENKVDMRIGGLFVRLIGKECDIGLESSAVKMIMRNNGIGAAITALSLSGPYLKKRDAVPPIRVDVEGTRLEYRWFPEDSDLERLLKLITPSKAQSDLGDDEIMIDTLLRQRRKGSVLRVTLDTVRTRAGDLHKLSCLPTLGDEIARLATVAKYLPEDDRPGLLCLGRIKTLTASADIGGPIGLMGASIKDLELAQITIPSLVAVGLDSLSVTRNMQEELINSPKSATTSHELAVMARMIGDEIEPIIKIRLHGLAFEYRVPTLMELLGLGADATPQDFEAELAMSVANLGEQAHATLTRRQRHPASTVEQTCKGKEKAVKPLTVDLVLRDCFLGLNPMGLPSKMTIALTDSRLKTVLPKEGNSSAELEIKKASILLVDDVSVLDSNTSAARARRRHSTVSSQQVSEMCARGYVEICFISAAKAIVAITALDDDQKQVDVMLRDDLLVIETCADSTQTLISLANALKPPTPPSKENKFRTKIMPVEDLLASISAEAFGRPEGEYDFDNDFAIAQEIGGDMEGDEELASDMGELDIQDDFFAKEETGEKLFDATSSSMMSVQASQASQASGPAAATFSNLYTRESSEVDSEDAELVVHENWFGKDSPDKGTAQVWNSTRNSYDRAPAEIVKAAPLKVAVRNVHVIWNLFDGYDWSRTKDVIAKAVHDVETKAYERRARTEEEELHEEPAVIGDFLFNSIYIEIPANRDPRELARAINQELQDNATETESVATTAYTSTTVRGGAPRPSKRLRLNRSKRHKITFELGGVDVDLIAFPPGSGETESSIDVRIKNLDIFDHVPTSTWKKFATYDQDAGEREMGSSMVHLELLNVKPQPDLAASDIVLRATLLPLRLHVDQDALDFITRFFGFKDEETAGKPSPSDLPFIQRAEVNDIPVKLDFKPKRVDYAGLRSGRTTEFMNFVILDEARMVLRHTIIYGVSGFERLGNTLNDIWMPDVRKNQLPGVLAGLAPVRSLVNVGSGFKDLIEIPLREYKKDGRIIRSISKGASAFVRTTGTEIVKLGAKVAVGTQYALQGAEGMLTSQPQQYQQPQQQQQQHADQWDAISDDTDSEEPKLISLYADQPTGVIQGLRGGYASLSRDLNLARDAIIAVPGAVMDSQGAQGVAKAVLKRAPTIIFRPAIGATKAIGQTLLGATNSLDPQNRRRVEEKYKKR